MLDVDAVRQYCLKKRGKISEGFPFGDDVLVLKVEGKMFALINLNSIPTTVNLKCDPQKAVELREKYDAVRPGYHMNKKYWNTVALNGNIPVSVVLSMIDHSYDEVVSGLPLTRRQKLQSK